METQRIRQLRPLGDVLGSLIAKAGIERRLTDAKVFTVWPGVVGAQIAANTRPVRLARGNLVVVTASSTWAFHLQLLSDALIEKLNRAVGRTAVKRVTFRVDDLAQSELEGGDRE